MAERAFTHVALNDDSVRITWTGLQNGDTGAPTDGMSEFDDRSVQVEGTFGSGGAALIKGSLDGTSFRTLNDCFGVALSITVEKIRAVTEYAWKIQPAVSGDGSTNLTVTMLCKRKRK